MPSSIVHRFSKFLSAATLVLIAAGGLVTSTDSGLSVPDWPLSYGTLFPPMIGGIRFEHSHRVIAGSIGILTLVLAVLVFRNEKRVWVKRLTLTAVAAVLLQAILGGLTVRYLLPLPISVAHACLGQSFFCLLVALTYGTSREWLGPPIAPSAGEGQLKRLALATAVVAYGQLIAGALVRHGKGLGLPVHYTGAFLIIVHLFLLHSKINREDSLREKFLVHSTLALLIACLQIGLGFGAFVYRIVKAEPTIRPAIQVLLTTAHQTTGALLLAWILLLTLRVFRLTRRQHT